jgi:arylsulfatase A-like enzyme
VNGISRIGYMSGGKRARWKDENIADVLTQHAVDFIKQNRANKFFLYFATHDIHVPRVPHPRFRGKTGMGPRGDAIAECDWSVGQILKTLDDLDLAGNTLVIFTSDNGPVVDDGYQDEAVEKLGAHKPAGPLRGGKSTAWEGGTREPFITRWPNHIAAGKTSDALICQIDLLASLAALTHQNPPLPPGEGRGEGALPAPDSQFVLPALLGQSNHGRDELVEQARVLALRQANWKYIEPAAGPNAKPQLYNLATDLAEQNNLAKQQPKKLKELQARLSEIRAAHRTP